MGGEYNEYIYAPKQCHTDWVNLSKKRIKSTEKKSLLVFGQIQMREGGSQH